MVIGTQAAIAQAVAKLYQDLIFKTRSLQSGFFYDSSQQAQPPKFDYL
jgi:hypothetical protein